MNGTYSEAAVDLTDATCHGNIFLGNAISSTGYYGIVVENGAFGNTFSNNTIANTSPSTPVYFHDAGGNATPNSLTGNTLTGSGQVGIVVSGTSNKNDFYGNDLTQFTATDSQVLVGQNANDNIFGSMNQFGKTLFDPSQTNTTVWIEGYNNQLVGNDYRGTLLSGWKLSAANVKQLGNIYLDASSSGNTIDEHGYFYSGTPCTQIADVTVTQANPTGANILNLYGCDRNIIVHTTQMVGQFTKHAALKTYLDQKHAAHAAWLENLKSGVPPYGPTEPTWFPEDMFAMGYVWDDATQQWVCPDGYYVDENGYCVQ